VDVAADLTSFAESGSAASTLDGQLLLTVSPVPLVATYERRHVLVSTVYSKSVLRAAAGEAEKRFPFVHYFPAYAIITAPGQSERYFADDLRQVTKEGVAHVMRLFAPRFFGTEEPAAAGVETGMRLRHRIAGAVACDEAELDPMR
jgi:hypothetical protein